MARLNPSLRKTLLALREFDGSQVFVAAINRGESPVDGVTLERLASDIDELEDAGMVKTFQGDGELEHFFLTSSGRDYLSNRLHEVLIAVCRSLFQLLCGAVGGLVVWVLTRQFS